MQCSLASGLYWSRNVCTAGTRMLVCVCVRVCARVFRATHRQDHECSAAWRLACTGHETCAQQVRQRVLCLDGVFMQCKA